MDAELALSRAITTLVLDEPFYGHILGGITRTIEERLPTAAVSVRGDCAVLSINPRWFLGLRHELERVAVVKHEALHLVFRHLLRRKPDQMPMLYNIAADLVVNQYIGSRARLPEGAITLSMLEDLELPADASVERYYELLLEDLKARPESERWKQLRIHFQGEHPDWHEAPAVEASLDRLIASAWTQTCDTDRRKLPLAVGGLAEAAVRPQPPQIDWRRVLHLFCGSGRRSALQPTMRRPSRRYGGFPGTKVRPQRRLLVAIDTSGSISEADLSDFFAEIFGIWRSGAEVIVAECDCVLQRVWSFDGERPEAVCGRGGTSFEPVFRWLEADVRRFDGLVYLTDGYGPPVRTVPRCPVLWVLARGCTVEPAVAGGRSSAIRLLR